MRRPLLVLFCFILIISFFITNKDRVISFEHDKEVRVEGIVVSKRDKDRYIEYSIGDYLVRDYYENLSLPLGYKVMVSGKFKDCSSMKFDDFDYGKYLRSVGYEGVIYLSEVEVINKNLFYYTLSNVKDKISRTVRYLYKDKSEFLNSILIGEKEFIDEDTKEVFSKTGVSHVLALSGLHVGVLIAMIGFSIGGINNIYKLFFISVILCLYAVMVGQSPSIVRAVLYSIISYIAIFICKRPDGMCSLSLIGSFLVINNPYIIYNVSFQLSFLATLSIIYFYGYIKSKVKFKVVALTISANILTIPILYLNFKSISVVAIISNALVVPILSIIIYMSIISVLIFPLSFTFSKILININKFIIECINLILEFLYNLNYSYIDFDETNKLLVFIYYIIVIGYMIFKEIKTVKEQENGLQGYHQEYEQRRV